MSEKKALLPLVAIVGPTASGKSVLGVLVAERFGGEVVACDSTQLYRGFDIGTAKPSLAERKGIPHHLIDILAPAVAATAGGYRELALQTLNDLRLRDRRELLKDILENAVPITLQDVVIVFVTVSGMRAGQLMQETYANKIYAAPMGGRVRSAIQITTAGGICAVLDMLSAGEIPQAGLIRQEEIGLKAFLANRFGKVYAMPAPAAAHAA